MTLQHRLTQRLNKHTLPAHTLIGRFAFPNEELRKRPEYQDNTWMPFWYYLGLEEQPKKILDVGSKFGLEAACCVLGIKTPAYVAIRKQQSRFTVKNIKLAHALVHNDMADWDLAIVNGDFSDQFDSIWHNIKLGGLICITDNKEALESFAKIKNRVPEFCKLRYSVGLLRK